LSKKKLSCRKQLAHQRHYKRQERSTFGALSFYTCVLYKFNRDDGTTPELCSRIDTKQLYLDSVTFTPETVCSTLKKLKPTTSLLIFFSSALSVPLAHIFDTSFEDNTLPYCGKTANVQPVFKKGCTNDPISLTSTCCRAMERIVNNHLLNYLLENQLISRHQHGFMRKKSTCTNLLECRHDWFVNI